MVAVSLHEGADLQTGNFRANREFKMASRAAYWLRIRCKPASRCPQVSPCLSWYSRWSWIAFGVCR